MIEPAEAHAIAPVKAGDGIVFDAASWMSPQEAEQGGRIYAVAQQRDGTLILRFGNRSVDFSRVRSGDLVWRTHDPDLDKTVRPYLEAARPIAKQPVSVRAVARERSPLQTCWSVNGVEFVVNSASELGSASNRVLTLEFLREQLSRLGNTPYTLAELELDIEGAPFAPASVLNQIRREAVEQLQALQTLTAPFTCVLPNRSWRPHWRAGCGTTRHQRSRNCISSCVLPSSWRLPSRGDRLALRWTISICTA